MCIFQIHAKIFHIFTIFSIHSHSLVFTETFLISIPTNLWPGNNIQFPFLIIIILYTYMFTKSPAFGPRTDAN